MSIFLEPNDPYWEPSPAPGSRRDSKAARGGRRETVFLGQDWTQQAINPSTVRPRIDDQVPGPVPVSTREVNDDVAIALRDVGWDASTLNVLRWPTGAGRWATLRLLLHQSDYEDLLGRAGDIDPNNPMKVPAFRVTMDTIEVERMYVVDEPKILVGPSFALLQGGVGSVYAVELVDVRWFWRQANVVYPAPGDEYPSDGDPGPISTGLNITKSDKSEFYPKTLNILSGEEVGEPWTYREAVKRLLVELVTLGLTRRSLLFVTENLVFNTISGLKDVVTEGRSIGELIDILLARCGYAMTAFRDGSMNFEPIGEGDRLALNEVLSTRFGPDIIAGGIKSFSSIRFGQAVNDGGMALHIAGLPGAVEADAPRSVRVHFPTSIAGRGGGSGGRHRWDKDEPTDQGRDYVVDRWYTVESSSGAPQDDQGQVHNGIVLHVFDAEWAIFGPDPNEPENPPWILLNGSELVSRADDVARSYFARFRAGVGELVFLGLVPIRQHAGWSEVRWRIIQTGDRAGFYTRVSGCLDDPIYGWFPRPNGGWVDSIGAVRAMPRGSEMLLDAPPDTKRLWLAKITFVDGQMNAFYDAEAYEDASIKVVNQRPYIVPVDDAVIDIEPAHLDDDCIIGERIDMNGEDEFFLLLVGETIRTTPCVQPSSAPSDDVIIMAAHGII